MIFITLLPLTIQMPKKFMCQFDLFFNFYHANLVINYEHTSVEN